MKIHLFQKHRIDHLPFTLWKKENQDAAFSLNNADCGGVVVVKLRGICLETSEFSHSLYTSRDRYSAENKHLTSDTGVLPALLKAGNLSKETSIKKLLITSINNL